MPAAGAAPGPADGAAEEDRLPVGDALLATEQAIQLDELIKWVKAQAAVGGTGKAVRISGSEEWTLGADSLIAVSKGHFDQADYQRQLRGDDGES